MDTRAEVYLHFFVAAVRKQVEVQGCDFQSDMKLLIRGMSQKFFIVHFTLPALAF